MSIPTVKTIEEDIKGLPLHDKLWLMELLARDIQENTQAAAGLPANGGHKATNGHAEDRLLITPESETGDGVRDRLSDVPSLTKSPLWADKSLLQTAMRKFIQELGDAPPPIGAKTLRVRISQEAHLEPNELSRGIIEMREEKLRALSTHQMQSSYVMHSISSR
jgi:hypothetical protein